MNHVLKRKGGLKNVPYKEYIPSRPNYRTFLIAPDQT